MSRLCTAAIALRHQIMVTANEVDRMDCLYRRNALGQNKAADYRRVNPPFVAVAQVA